MGYYDQRHFQQPNQPKRKQNRKTVFMVLISATIGGLLVLLFAPYLINGGWIDINEPQIQSEQNKVTNVTSVAVNSDITKAVDKVRSAVVGVETFANSDDIFSAEEIKEGSGSGIIFEKKGGKAKVVTNYHVIQGSQDVRVVIPLENNDAQSVKATVLGTDPATDLAVLEIDDEHVSKVAEFGDSTSLKAGEPAIAIGNPLGRNFSQSVTVGVISSPVRTIQVSELMETEVIQTDAAINPGNSGGALVNVAGQVIGINSLKIAQQGIEGLGFAIPSNQAQPIINHLIQHGYVPRPYLGIQLISLQELAPHVVEELNLPASVESGVVVRSVEMGTAAANANLKARDVIVEINGNKINNSTDLRNFLYDKTQVGETITITYYRDGRKETTKAQLTESQNDQG